MERGIYKVLKQHSRITTASSLFAFFSWISVPVVQRASVTFCCMDKYTTRGVVFMGAAWNPSFPTALFKLDFIHNGIKHPDTDSSFTGLIKFYNFIRTDSMERQHAVQSAVHVWQWIDDIHYTFWSVWPLHRCSRSAVDGLKVIRCLLTRQISLQSKDFFLDKFIIPGCQRLQSDP